VSAAPKSATCAACADEAAGGIAKSMHRCDKPKPSAPPQITCSFCGAGHREVAKMIAGPRVNICNECVDLCNDILAETLEATVDGDETATCEPAACATLADERSRFLRLLAGRPRPLYGCPASRLLTGARP